MDHARRTCGDIVTLALAVVLLAATVALLGALVVLHVAPTGLSPVGEPVSRYALTRWHAGYAVAAASAAVAGAVAALLVPQRPAVVPALLWLFAAVRALIPFFPMDAPGVEPTRHGSIHRLLAVIAFATVTLAAVFAAAGLRDAGHPALSTLTRVCSALMIVGTIGTVVAARAPAVRPLFGLMERLIYLGMIAWFGILAIAFLAA